MWSDRKEAGRELGDHLYAMGYGGRDDVFVLGIPRGGVEVAAEVARALGAPLDVVVVRKIGSPGNSEFAAGAVDSDGRIYLNPDAGVSAAYLEAEGALERAEARRRIDAYRAGRPESDLSGATVIVVDDGIATGLTARAAIESVRGRGARFIALAAPVISPGARRILAPAVDGLIALDVPEGFHAVGAHYGRFPQLSDDDVRALLASA